MILDVLQKEVSFNNASYSFNLNRGINRLIVGTFFVAPEVIYKKCSNQPRGFNA
jgi:hypothetical protein